MIVAGDLWRYKTKNWRTNFEEQEKCGRFDEPKGLQMWCQKLLKAS